MEGAGGGATSRESTRGAIENLTGFPASTPKSHAGALAKTQPLDNLARCEATCRFFTFATVSTVVQKTIRLRLKAIQKLGGKIRSSSEGRGTLSAHTGGSSTGCELFTQPLWQNSGGHLSPRAWFTSLDCATVAHRIPENSAFNCAVLIDSDVLIVVTAWCSMLTFRVCNQVRRARW